MKFSFHCKPFFHYKEPGKLPWILKVLHGTINANSKAEHFLFYALTFNGQ